MNYWSIEGKLSFVFSRRGCWYWEKFVEKVVDTGGSRIDRRRRSRVRNYAVMSIHSETLFELAIFCSQDVEKSIPLGENLIARDRAGEPVGGGSSMLKLSSTVGVRIGSGWMLIKAAAVIEVNSNVVNIRRINVNL